MGLHGSSSPQILSSAAGAKIEFGERAVVSASLRTSSSVLRRQSKKGLKARVAWRSGWCIQPGFRSRTDEPARAMWNPGVAKAPDAEVAK
jgi:hypothetical protein